MKKLTLICAVFAATTLSAQTFSDNFDSYTAGQKLALQSGGAWTTWSNAPGGTEDTYVSNAMASSMPNSIYFSSTVQAGGPVDQVRNFGVLNTGQFSMGMKMYIESTKGAYFNFQKNATIGQTWAADVHFEADGTFNVVNTSGLNFNASMNYPQDTWFDFRIDINFNTNQWEVFFNNVSAGSFANTENQIASIDIFPLLNNSFYIDDYEYTVTPYTLPNLNLAATLVSFTGANLAGASVVSKVKVRNLGTTTINTFDFNVNYNGVDHPQSVSGQNLASLAETEITLTAPITLVAGSNMMTATISNVNGNMADDDMNDDMVTVEINPIVPAPGKVVFGEEGTGTWCGWCPRGAVFMDKMAQTYGDFWIGAAVHNGDPMTVATYDAGIGGLITGYPSALVDRGPAIDPSQMEVDFLQRITQAPTALITNTAIFLPVTRELTVTVNADFQLAANSNFKLGCVLVEDEVTGTGSGYNQTNYYAGGGNGVMGGYETLPSSVPAAQMVYNHVARAIAPDFNGMENSFPATVNVGENHSQTFTFILPAEWDMNNMHIVGLLFDPAGKVDNAGKMNMMDATMLDEFAMQCPSADTMYLNTDGNLVPDYTNDNIGGTTCTTPGITYTQTPAAGATLTNGTNTITVTGTDNCGNTGSCNLTVFYIDNASVISLENSGVSIYPNPVQNELNITSKQNFKAVVITSADGRTVFTQNALTNNTKLVLNQLNNGIYNVSLTLENGQTLVSKFVKQ